MIQGAIGGEIIERRVRESVCGFCLAALSVLSAVEGLRFLKMSFSLTVTSAVRNHDVDADFLFPRFQKPCGLPWENSGGRNTSYSLRSCRPFESG